MKTSDRQATRAQIEAIHAIIMRRSGDLRDIADSLFTAGHWANWKIAVTFQRGEYHIEITPGPFMDKQALDDWVDEV